MLAEKCDPVTFGRKNEAVLDGAYRKAGKHFCTFFDATTRCDLM